ncbi:hypothetical protein V493_01656 [Pseudogymnoascus sp. VKM F-4281 (FW-2241)]|nr:hypothetical protein V493_01656 [Pseudogymnoascus sp. VKM F-4281 (FW-2241)]
MAYPRQHIFGLGLALETDGDTAHRNDDGLGLFSDIYDVDVSCSDTDRECPGMGTVSSNQNTDINSQIQPSIRIETPRLLVSNSPDIQQHPVIGKESPEFLFNNSRVIQQEQPLAGNEPTGSHSINSWGTHEQPIIIKETPELSSDESWGIQQQHFDFDDTNGSQPLLGDLFTSIWDLPSPSDPIWSHFPRHPFQAQTNNGTSNHEANLISYNEHEQEWGSFETWMNNGTSNREMSFIATNEYDTGFAGHAQIPQAQTSYVNRDVTHTTRPEQGNLRPVGQEISSDTINELSALHPLRQYLAEFPQQLHGLLRQVEGEEHIQVPNEAPISQRPVVKRLKTNNGNAAPGLRKVKANDGKVNPRTARRIELDPTQYYQPLAHTPQSWGTINPDGRHKFRYNGFGELRPEMTFTSDEMLEYLYGTFPRINNLESNNPSLFIQCVPSDSNSRYPTTLSSKCRFTHCPVKMRTIPSGHFRVAFDEQNDEKLDPYHCAGYVHLYCLERFCSFNSLAKYCNLAPDTRELREGKNRMSITRDHSEFARLCMVYIEDSTHRDPHANGWNYKNTLCSLLTEEYLRLEAKVRRATRERQGGNNIGVHRNDMELYAWGQEHKMLSRLVAAQTSPRKRKCRSDVEDQDGNNGYE